MQLLIFAFNFKQLLSECADEFGQEWVITLHRNMYVIIYPSPNLP